MFDTCPQLVCNDRVLRLDGPQVMGIVNVSPDSFADGGEQVKSGAGIEAGARRGNEILGLPDVLAARAEP